ncbi:LuxR C-terminal-related transcriptional regulator [Rhizorhabdus wittichii]|uniref:LuxR C-terminal-related transcriptional regulator n=1 Tax=Rhizorhabdus wittichii TaxID=160791 RepID=UPI00035ECE1C|nr:LuxR C-terminal-related transcriptional regulator [Rhizorhabdus wittichii]
MMTAGRSFDQHDWLRDPLAPPILLVEAGAGYDKTRWCETLRDRALEAGFTTLFIEPASTSASQLGELVDAAERGAGPLLLVIDGFDRAPDRRFGEAIADISARQRPGDRIAIASRNRIAIRFRRRWISGGAARVNEAALGFGRDQTAALFEGALPDNAVDMVLAWSEGWPTAVEAVHLGWQRKRRTHDANDMARLIDEIWPDVASYIEDEILSDLAAPQRDLMIRTAFLETFDGDLAHKLTGDASTWDVLDQLVDRHVLAADEGSDPSYRCHPLVRRRLESDLRKRGGEFRHLARKAAQIFWQRQDVQRAITCADLAGDGALAARWALSLDTAMFGVSRGGRELREVMQHVPVDILETKPRLALAHAFLAAKSGRIDVADRILQHVRTTELNGAAGSDRLLARDTAIVEVAIAMYDGRGFGGPALAALDMIEAVSYGDEGIRGFVENVRCAIAFDASDFPEALARYRNALHFYTCQNATNGLGYIHLHSGRIYAEMLNIEACARAYDHARQLFLEQRPQDEQSLRLIKPLQARLAYDQGRFEEAQRLSDGFAAEVGQGGYYWDALYLGFRTAAKLAARRHGDADARRTLDGAIEFARLNRIGHLEHLLLLERAALAPESDDVAHLLDRGPLHAASPLPWRIRDLRAVVRARRGAMAGDLDGALARLFAQLDECHAQGRQRSRIDLLIAASLLLDQGQRRERAIDMLHEATRLARKGHIVAPFIENGRDALALLSLLASGAVDGNAAGIGNDPFVSQVLALQDEAPSGPATLLNQRERDILRHLAEGMSNKLIARQLNISPETVRYYLKGIYEKYGLHGGYANRRALAHFVTQTSATHH